MKLQMLVSALEQDVRALPRKMRLERDAVIINQCGENAYQEYAYRGYTMRCYSFCERGVGRSRNNALLRAEGELVLFSDDDIVYDEGYADAVEREFALHPEADMLLFNVRVRPERRPYHTTAFGRVRLYNCGRYPAYSFAARTRRLREKNLTFSLLFGGGAEYANGEDSLFISDCIRRGLKVYKTPTEIGEEKPERASTWFHGYTEKFFFDRGVLYHYLYGTLAVPLALRFLGKHGKTMCVGLSFGEAFREMRKGIRSVSGV